MTQAVEPRTQAALDEAASKGLGDKLGDASWLASLRARGAATATQQAMPTPYERPWKYMDISEMSLDAYAPIVGPETNEEPDALRKRYTVPADAPAAVIFENSTPVLLEQEKRLLVPFTAADEAEQKLLEARVGSAIHPDRNKLVALHYGFMAGGLLVNVPAGFEDTKPIRITRSYKEEGQLATPHTLIVTGANSHVRIVEDYRSTDDDMVAIPAVEILPGPDSRVEYTSLHRWGKQTRVFKQQQTITDRGSEVLAVTMATGAKDLKYHIETALEGRGSASDVLGLTVGHDAQQHDFYTLQDHIGEDTRSDLMIKSALDDQSRAVYYGVTRVGLGARRSDANQENRNLLLSKQAKADSDPVLEILTNDVLRCSHGATAGPVNEEQLYYLETRGIDRASAEDLLVWGFLSQVLDRVPDEALREEIAESLRASLEKEGA